MLPDPKIRNPAQLCSYSSSHIASDQFQLDSDKLTRLMNIAFDRKLYILVTRLHAFVMGSRVSSVSIVTILCAGRPKNCSFLSC